MGEKLFVEVRIPSLTPFSRVRIWLIRPSTLSSRRTNAPQAQTLGEGAAVIAAVVADQRYAGAGEVCATISPHRRRPGAPWCGSITKQ